MALSLANFSSNEGSVNGTTTITFPWKAKEITVINNSISDLLQFKFSSGETLGTLRGGETITVKLSSKTVFLSSTVSVDYRVWGLG